MLRQSVPKTLDELSMILRIPEGEEFGILFWHISARIQDKEKSMCVDEISELSGVVVCG
jgi:hypothetical protein